MNSPKRTSPQKIKAHFKKVDPKIYAFVKEVDFGDLPVLLKNESEYFERLCRIIVGQQLSGKAASTIYGRFKELFGGKKITPLNVSKLTETKMRNAGMSWSKASFLKDLAKKTMNKEIEYKKLHEMNDEDVIKELMKVKGIGPWTAEMFLMFAIGREDVFSYADLGLRNGMKVVYGLKEVPDAKKAERITNKWRPYRSYGSLGLWHSID